MKLAEYIEKRCVSQRALARKIGISFGTLKRISQGYDFCISLAFLIEEATGGDVKLADLEPVIPSSVIGKRRQLRKKEKEVSKKK